jgi:hypothetical protein
MPSHSHSSSGMRHCLQYSEFIILHPILFHPQPVCLAFRKIHISDLGFAERDFQRFCLYEWLAHFFLHSSNSRDHFCLGHGHGIAFRGLVFVASALCLACLYHRHFDRQVNSASAVSSKIFGIERNARPDVAGPERADSIRLVIGFRILHTSCPFRILPRCREDRTRCHRLR